MKRATRDQVLFLASVIWFACVAGAVVFALIAG